MLKLRYKAPEGGASKLISRVLEQSDIRADLAETSDNYRFSAAVAWFGQILRRSKMVADDATAVAALASAARGEDEHGYRSEFIQLTRTVAAMPVARAPTASTMEQGQAGQV